MTEKECISRDDARKRGLSRFYTATLCHRGHDAERYVADGKCVRCVSLTNAKKHSKFAKSTPEERAEAAEKRRQHQEEKARRKALYKQSSESRQEAIREGYTTYYTPRPCPKGHIGYRYTSSGGCVECHAEVARSQKKKQYDRQYYEENKEYIRKKAGEYNKRTKEYRTQMAKEWARKNPEKRRIISLSYKARRRSQERQGDSTADIREWESGQKKVCYWCGTKCPDDYHVDHYVPLAKGGPHTINNLVIACPTCNFTKSAKDPYEFAQERGRLF